MEPSRNIVKRVIIGVLIGLLLLSNNVFAIYFGDIKTKRLRVYNTLEIPMSNDPDTLEGGISYDQNDYVYRGADSSGQFPIGRKHFEINIALAGPNAITGNDKLIIWKNVSGMTATIDNIVASATASSNWQVLDIGSGGFNWTNLTGMSVNWDDVSVVESVTASTLNEGAQSGVNWYSFGSNNVDVSTIANWDQLGINWQAGIPNEATMTIQGHYDANKN